MNVKITLLYIPKKRRKHFHKAYIFPTRTKYQPTIQRLYDLDVTFFFLNIASPINKTDSNASAYSAHIHFKTVYILNIRTMKTDLFNVSWFFFPLLSTPDLTFISNSAGVSTNAEDAYRTSAPGPCSRFLEEPELLIYVCYLCIILVTLCSFVIIEQH